MVKWILIFLGGGVLLVMAIMAIFAFMVWNHTRGYPKSILSDDARDICMVSTKPFFFVKNNRASLREEMAALLPIPDGVDHYYVDYIPTGILLSDGSEFRDLTGLIEVPAGTRFILKDGFQRRTINENEYLYWLEPEGISLDSSYFHNASHLTAKNGKIGLHTDEEMAQLSRDDLFERACDEGG